MGVSVVQFAASDACWTELSAAHEHSPATKETVLARRRRKSGRQNEAGVFAMHIPSMTT